MLHYLHRQNIRKNDKLGEAQCSAFSYLTSRCPCRHVLNLGCTYDQAPWFLCSSCPQHSLALGYFSHSFLMRSYGKGEICSILTRTILSSSCFSPRALRKSQNTFPVQKTTFFTPLGFWEDGPSSGIILKLQRIALFNKQIHFPFEQVRLERKDINFVPEEVGSLLHEIKGGPSFRVSKQRLGGHEDERLAEGKSYLATQDVEVVGGGGAVGYYPVGIMQLSNFKTKPK